MKRKREEKEKRKKKENQERIKPVGEEMIPQESEEKKNTSKKICNNVSSPSNVNSFLTHCCRRVLNVHSEIDY